MDNFGLLNRVNGLDHLPYWSDAPCNSIRASEGKTKNDAFVQTRKSAGCEIAHGQISHLPVTFNLSSSMRGFRGVPKMRMFTSGHGSSSF